MPDSLFHVWRAFIDLHNARSSGFGPNPISYSEIYTYCVLYKVTFDDWELDLIRKFDSEVLKIYSEQQEKSIKKKSK